METKICHFYQRGQCKFGPKECKFRHPKLCKKFKKFGKQDGGCTQGKECPRLHVRHCRMSVLGGTCDPKRCRSKYHLQSETSTNSQQTKNTPKIKSDAADPDFHDESRFQEDRDRLKLLEDRVSQFGPLMTMMEKILSSILAKNLSA